MGIQLQLILTAYFVNSGWTLFQLDDPIADLAVTSNYGGINQENIPNLFNSISKNNVKKGEVYQKIIKREVAKGQQTFNKMKEELWNAQNRNGMKRRHLYKRSNAEVTSSTEPLESTLSASQEKQLWADLRHMQSAASVAPTVEIQTKQTRYSMRTFEEQEPGHKWERFPKTSPFTNPRTYAFSARSMTTTETLAANMTTTNMSTTISTTFRFTKKQRKFPQRIIDSMKYSQEPNSKMVVFDW